MKKYTKLSVQWFYELLERGECDIMDFKEQLEDKKCFGKSLKNFAPNYEEMARDVVAFANLKGGFLFVGIVDNTKEFNSDFKYSEQKINELIKQVQGRTIPTITIRPHRLRLVEGEVLVLEIPFSPQMHRTSRGEFLIYESQTGKGMKLDQLLVLNEILNTKRVKLSDLEKHSDININRLHTILHHLEELEFIESSGKTSGTSYLLHVSKRKTTEEKVDYVKSKKQEKARQKEAIIRYLDSIDTINNAEARLLLRLQETDRSYVSRLLKSLVEDDELLERVPNCNPNNILYRLRKNK